MAILLNGTDDQAILQAAEILKNHKLVAFPTETVYGLGANALSDEACLAIYQVKNRPQDNPFIIHCHSALQAKEFVYTNELADFLWQEFSPGPLTIVLKKKSQQLSNIATASLETVAIRMPKHPTAQALLKAVALPLAAPSANLSTKLSATTAQMVFETLGDKIAAILQNDADITEGLESTVIAIDEKASKIIILRPGSISKQDFAQRLPDITIEVASAIKVGQTVRSPGQKYQHYRPKQPLYLFDRSEKIDYEQFFKSYQTENIALVTFQAPSELDKIIGDGQKYFFKSVEEYAQKLYNTLYFISKQANITMIVAERPEPQGLGLALYDRLTRASTVIIK